MTAKVLGKTKMLEVNRSHLRQHQSRWLKRARGRHVLLIKSNDAEEEKIVLDRQFFEEIGRKLEGLVETLEIAMDRKLFNQILATADTLRGGPSLGQTPSAERHLRREIGGD